MSTQLEFNTMLRSLTPTKSGKTAYAEHLPKVHGHVAIAEAKRFGFKSVWNSALKTPVSLDEARQDIKRNPKEIWLYDSHDPLMQECYAVPLFTRNCYSARDIGAQIAAI